jgi:enoyl-CoA hydratase/carnithine racemase
MAIINTELRDAVGTVAFNNPGQRNVLSTVNTP